MDRARAQRTRIAIREALLDVGSNGSFAKVSARRGGDVLQRIASWPDRGLTEDSVRIANVPHLRFNGVIDRARVEQLPCDRRLFPLDHIEPFETVDELVVVIGAVDDARAVRDGEEEAQVLPPIVAVGHLAVYLCGVGGALSLLQRLAETHPVVDRSLPADVEEVDAR